ncbi:TIGR03862 family flavoprotein [Litoreibacter roseus]|uniref:NAD(FAD)-utilizing dehydrogenase n=1 Tax=Litoreibacter roseus TaxID=2601869 RepID=A0A6N6JJ12_9RHOB|nr:TIGR03862 family flavoprotein [Litoreibacter roseus]GFE66256.1 NAD(FAD)-utilizing dehydrogenase [Litoreibacter roseus]
MKPALVIGAGPAGLMAADRLAAAGLPVVMADQKPSFGRKFLMAGKSGLNLTKIEDRDRFNAAYAEATPLLQPMIENFGPDAIIAWAEALGQGIFKGSTGRVFPQVMKASPLLRAWLARLDDLGVERRVRWRWSGFSEQDCMFDTPEGPQRVTPSVTVLAMGGASWARLGSDGAWATHMGDRIDIAPFQPANVGFRVTWSDHMAGFFGTPLKNIALHAGSQRTRGEVVISEQGIEGGGIYEVSRPLRDGAPLTLDLLPDLTPAQITDRLSGPRGKASLSNHIRKTLKLPPAKLALLQEFARPLPSAPEALAAIIKSLPVRLNGPMEMEGAISTAGGIVLDALDNSLMLKSAPGVFAAGEMLDWEAPTGGYLLTACLATGRWAGDHAAEWAKAQDAAAAL